MADAVLEKLKDIELCFSEKEKGFYAVLPSGRRIKRKTFNGLQAAVAKEIGIDLAEPNAPPPAFTGKSIVIRTSYEYKCGILTGKIEYQRRRYYGRTISYEVEFEDGSKEWFFADMLRVGTKQDARNLEEIRAATVSAHDEWETCSRRLNQTFGRLKRFRP